jgi:large subunit ribosomal protein L18
MTDKNESRLRRARQVRLKIRELRVLRLTVHRSNSHIYAQVIDASGAKVLASASTLEPEVRKSIKVGGNAAAAAAVGKRIAEKAKQLGIEAVAFDRAGYRYHGRVKALAEAAREHGLKF